MNDINYNKSISDQNFYNPIFDYLRYLVIRIIFDIIRNYYYNSKETIHPLKIIVDLEIILHPIKLHHMLEQKSDLY